MPVQTTVDQKRIADFCQRHGIVRLAFFGSVTGNNFRDDSDVDILVDYAADAVPDFISLFDHQNELTAILGRRVDLHTRNSLSRYFRDDVLRSAVVQYAA